MKTLNQQSINHLIYHILDGYRSSHEGIVYAKKKGLLTEPEVIDLLTKNSERLIKRIVEFKIIERLVAIFFAGLFGFLQLTCNDLDMRKARSLRMRRRQNVEVVK